MPTPAPHAHEEFATSIKSGPEPKTDGVSVYDPHILRPWAGIQHERNLYPFINHLYTRHMFIGQCAQNTS
jgi:hypothetical protein